MSWRDGAVWGISGCPVASATATQQGNRNWDLFFSNESSTAVTNASATVNSGFDPAGFDWNGPVTSFPAARSTPDIAAGEQWEDGLVSEVPVTFALGYDSTRTVSPAAIPAGGGRQTDTVTLTPEDPRFTPAPDPGHLGVKASFNVITVGCGRRVVGKVAVLLPEVASASPWPARWETWDRPLLRSAFVGLGLTDSQILMYNAH